MRKTLAVIYGGRSAEHEVSKISGKSVAENLDKEKFVAKEVFIDKKGKWFVNGQPVGVEEALGSVDIAFPVMHGTYGEDGKIQGLFDMLNLPFAGPGVTESAVGMDKEFSKIIWEKHQLPTTKFISIKRFEWQDNKVKQIEASSKFNLPIFVKPAVLGSSIGITKVKNLADLEKAVEFAFQYGEKILVEQAVPEAREIEVSLLGNDKVEVSVAGEIIPANEFYDYNAKYENENSKLLIPAPLNEQLMQQIQQTAVRAYKVLGLYGFARADFLLNKNTNQFFISEVNTIPGFTPISMFPKLWEHSGLSYKELLTKLVDLAIAKYNEKSKYKV